MSIRNIRPEDIRPGQVIRVTQRWPGDDVAQPWTRAWRGVVDRVTATGDAVVFTNVGGTVSRPIIREHGGCTVEITLMAEPVDPRTEVVVNTMMTTLDVAWSRATAERLTARILANLDKMEES